MKCKYCGAELEDESEFCTNCGRKVEPEVSEHAAVDVAASAMPNNKKMIFIIVIIIVFAASCLAGRWIYGVITSGHESTYSQNNNDYSSSDENSDDEYGDNADENTDTDDYASSPEITAIEATSHLKANKGTTYVADNLFDGDESTCWIKARKESAVGQKLTISLDGTQTVNGLTFSNGYQKSHKAYVENSKPTKIKVTFDNGDSEVLELNSSFDSDSMTTEDIDFQSEESTTTIVIEILGYEEGTKDGDHDVAISEITPY